MQEMTVNAVTDKSHLNKYLIPAIILVFVLLVSLFAYRSLNKPGSVVTSSEMTEVSQSILEEKYGLHVNLIAVTAVGGLVDVRLKIVNGEKAKSLLQDPAFFPALWIADNNVTLNVSEDTKPQEIQFKDNSNLFLIYPNVGSVVKPGTPVTIVFGDLQVEPILAK